MSKHEVVFTAQEVEELPEEIEVPYIPENDYQELDFNEA